MGTAWRAAIAWLRKLSLSGVTQGMDARQAKRIVLSNQISLSVALLNLPYVIIYPFLGSKLLGWLEIPLFLGYASIHRFNVLGWSSFSRLFLVVLADLDISSYCLSLGRGSGMHMLLLLACWTPLALFDWSEKKSMLFSIGLSSALFMACEAFVPLHGTISPLRPAAEKQLHLITVATLALVQILFAIYFLVANRRTEQALSRALQAAGDADLAKSRFLARINGKIAVPLAAMRSAAKVAARSAGTPHQMDLIRDIETSAEDLSLLVGEILDKSRIDAGRMRLENADFELLPMLHALLRPFEFEAATKGVALRLEAADGLPAIVHGDATRLKQVLRNLIHNALKFTQRGQVTLKLRRGEPGMLAFEIEDTGPGIPEGATDRIFEPFYQGDQSESRQHRGTGLGLYISKELVELMGGRIGFRTRSGQGMAASHAAAWDAAAQGAGVLGTVFHFTLPVKGAPTTMIRRDAAKG